VRHLLNFQFRVFGSGCNGNGNRNENGNGNGSGNGVRGGQAKGYCLSTALRVFISLLHLFVCVFDTLCVVLVLVLVLQWGWKAF